MGNRTLFWISYVAYAATLGFSTEVATEVLLPIVLSWSKSGKALLNSSLAESIRHVPQPVWMVVFTMGSVALAIWLAISVRDPLSDMVAIAIKSIRQRALASSMTALSVALGVALMITILIINAVVTRMFSQSATGYDLVLGAKGSPMQLVLNTIYFMDKPIENVPYSEYLKIKSQKSWVTHAIPMNLGDTTPDGRYRVVGTLPEYFEVPYVPGKKFQLREGAWLKDSHDAILGSRVAAEYGWRIGHQFPLAHGGDVEHLHLENPFQVAGILAPTGTPSDRAVFVHLEGFFTIRGHLKPEKEALERKQALEGKAAADEAKAKDPFLDKEVTAVLVRSNKPIYVHIMRSEINEKNPYFQAVNPIEQISRLLKDVVEAVRTMLVVMTWLIIVVSSVGIFVSIYNSMADRRREIAIMRALGANRGTVFSIIVTESVLICTVGALTGFLLGHALVFAAGWALETHYGVLVDPGTFEKSELSIVPGLFLLAVLVGVVPGITAYREDVARGLQD